MCTIYLLDFYSIQKSIPGDRTTWTPDDYYLIEKALPDGFTVIPKESSPAKLPAILIGSSY